MLKISAIISGRVSLAEVVPLAEAEYDSPVTDCATAPTISTDSSGCAAACSSTTAARTPFSMPCRTSCELAPAATIRIPPRTISRDSTAAVALPSPTRSRISIASSRTSIAPTLAWRFENFTMRCAMVAESPSTSGGSFVLRRDSRRIVRPTGPSVEASNAVIDSTPCPRARWTSGLNKQCGRPLGAKILTRSDILLSFERT